MSHRYNTHWKMGQWRWEGEGKGEKRGTFTLYLTTSYRQSYRSEFHPLHQFLVVPLESGGLAF